MAEFSDSFGRIFQNLVDCGFDEISAETYAKQIADGNAEKAMQRLKIHRQNLLNKVHENQKRIDCLDFLVYSIGKNQGGNDHERKI